LKTDWPSGFVTVEAANLGSSLESIVNRPVMSPLVMGTASVATKM
jgi:hypothetical protein